MYIYYTYKLVHINTNQIYIGSRKTKKSNPYDDLGIKYFSSSKIVKEIGFDNFYFGVIETFNDFDSCYWSEQNLIETNFLNLCLNRSYYRKTNNSRIFSMSGRKQTKEHIEKRISNKKGKPGGMKGKFHSEETKLKISNSNKGKKLTPESIEKIRIGNIGKVDTQETKLKKSLSKIGKPSNAKGHKQTEDHKKKVSEKRIAWRNSLTEDQKKDLSEKLSKAIKGKKKSGIKATSIKILCRISDKKEFSKASACKILKDLKPYFL